MKIVDAKKLLNKEKNVAVAVVVFGLICIRMQKIFILDSFGLCVCVRVLHSLFKQTLASSSLILCFLRSALGRTSP